MRERESDGQGRETNRLTHWNADTLTTRQMNRLRHRKSSKRQTDRLTAREAI